MLKAFRIWFFVLTLVSLTLSAMPVKALEGCQVTVAVDDSVVPVEATINVSGVDGLTMVDFGDFSPQSLGRSFVHDYFAEGSFKITAVVNVESGGIYRCHAYADTASGTQPHTVYPRQDRVYGSSGNLVEIKRN